MTMFPAKILLIGEYSILLGSSALSIPFSHFSGSLKFIREEINSRGQDPAESNRQLVKMHGHYLENSQVFNKFLDLDHFRQDIDKGLFFQSTIPQRYGMGSSGALCAAVFDAYGSGTSQRSSGTGVDDLALMRNSFMQMESFFHGKSSGFDPLVSWLNTPVRLDKEGELTLPAAMNSGLAGNEISLLLVDSGLPCSTGPLVGNFMAAFTRDGTATSTGAELCDLANAAIEKLLGDKADDTWETLRCLSGFQLINLASLIPVSLIPAWQYGLKTSLFSLKLCGSGGGGFLLCFTRNKEKTLTYFNLTGVPLLPVPC